MECVYADDWNHSFWFTEWLNLARKKNEDGNKKENQTARMSKKKPGAGIHHEIAPLFTDWRFSVRENSTLHLPELDFRLELAKNAGQHLDAPHAADFV
jgi:hypothetical protein